MYKFFSRVVALVVTVCVLAPFTANADDGNWGHWRGPTGNSISESGTPPTVWSDTKNVKWKVAIPGKGTGSPVIWEDKVFVVTGLSEQSNAQPAARSGQRGRRGRGGARPTATEFKVLCFDRGTGKQIWEQTATTATPHQGVHSTNNFASASPCTDGQHVYAFFGSRGVFCYTMDGKLVWKRDNFGAMNTKNNFGEGASPTLADDKIIIPWDHEGQSAIYALDKLTGKTIWKTDRDEPTNWSTPLLVEQNGKKQIVMNGQTCARSYDLASGKELWHCAGQTSRPCSSAVAGDGLIFVGSGHRGSYLGAFQMDGLGDLEDTSNVVWSINRDTPDIASPMLSDGRLYFHKGKSGAITCLDAKTGKPHFPATRVPGIANVYASPIAAGGHVYLTGRNGTTVVINDADSFEIVATNSVGEPVDATPAPAGDELFIRGEKHLFCIAK